MVGIKQYPYFYEKYVPQLINAMISFLKSLSTKKIYSKWIKKTILNSLMQSLDAKRF